MIDACQYRPMSKPDFKRRIGRCPGQDRIKIVPPLITCRKRTREIRMLGRIGALTRSYGLEQCRNIS